MPSAETGNGTHISHIDIHTRTYAPVIFLYIHTLYIYTPHAHTRTHTHPHPVGRASRREGTPMSPHKYFVKIESVNTKKGSVNTMTEKTKTLSIRLNTEDRDVIGKYLNRGSVEAMLRQIKRGEISITSKGVVIERVNTKRDGVNTTIEPTSKRNAAIEGVNTTLESVNTDKDGEWVREIAHDLNIDVNVFKKKIEQSIYR